AARIDAHRNIRRLLLDGRDNTTSVGVKTILRTCVTHAAHHVARYVSKIHESRCRDLTGNHYEAGCDERFAGDATHGVVLHDGVQNCVRYLVSYFVGVALGDRLRGEQELLIGMRQDSLLQRYT